MRKAHFIVEELFIKSWWVWICFIGSFSVYERANHALFQEKETLQAQIQLSSKKLQDATTRQEELKLKVQSMSDPALIELIIIQGLGVVPEGYTKIYFQEKCDRT